jgi:hypothetical protein
MGCYLSHGVEARTIKFAALPSRERKGSGGLYFRLVPLVSSGKYNMDPRTNPAEPTPFEQLYDIFTGDAKVVEWLSKYRPYATTGPQEFFNAYVRPQDELLAIARRFVGVGGYAVEMCCEDDGNFGHQPIARYNPKTGPQTTAAGGVAKHVYRCVGYVGFRTVSSMEMGNTTTYGHTAVFDMFLHKNARLYSEVIVRAACWSLVHELGVDAEGHPTIHPSSYVHCLPAHILIPHRRVNEAIRQLIVELKEQAEKYSSGAYKDIEFEKSVPLADCANPDYLKRSPAAHVPGSDWEVIGLKADPRTFAFVLGFLGGSDEAARAPGASYQADSEATTVAVTPSGDPFLQLNMRNQRRHIPNPNKTKATSDPETLEAAPNAQLIVGSPQQCPAALTTSVVAPRITRDRIAGARRPVAKRAALKSAPSAAQCAA